MSNESVPTKNQLPTEPLNPRFRNAIEASWSGETASAVELWTAANAAQGHCDVTSLVVREQIGGDLKMAQVFRNGALSEHHYWNVLPNGQELDLTSSQFDGTESFGDATLMDDEFFEQAGPMNPRLIERLNQFRAAVLSHPAMST